MYTSRRLAARRVCHPIWPLLLICLCVAILVTIYHYYFPGLYDELGVPRGATIGEVRRAYHRWALKYHPDKHPTESAYYAAMTSAFKAILEEDSRVEYDTWLGIKMMISEMYYDPTDSNSMHRSAAHMANPPYAIRGVAWYKYLAIACVVVLVGLLSQLMIVVWYHLFRFLHFLGRGRASGGVVWMIVAFVTYANWLGYTGTAVLIVFLGFVADYVYFIHTPQPPTSSSVDHHHHHHHHHHHSAPHIPQLSVSEVMHVPPPSLNIDAVLERVYQAAVSRTPSVVCSPASSPPSSPRSDDHRSVHHHSLHHAPPPHFHNHTSTTHTTTTNHTSTLRARHSNTPSPAHSRPHSPLIYTPEL
eukprot:TRINITY_DN1026_c0_g2_i1.p1 TRINITY_DN1026_c0_g2~~TRINITY_DN1026_c0_g2_i1.p1  ORF type:complete len:359 (-),score=52.68 TRINITY_DN1026_c0_g2_i1:43-1119(-)